MVEENKIYWQDRSLSYAQENLKELQTEKRFKWEKIFLEKLVDINNKKILDIGCGPGIFSIILSTLGGKVSGIDFSVDMIKNAKNNARIFNQNIEFINGDAQNLPFDNESFDIVVSRNLTWNLADPQIAYKQWHRVLKKEGILLNFDANWYLWLFDNSLKEEYLRNTKELSKLNITNHYTQYPNTQKMEKIAKNLPLSKIYRPKWDKEILRQIGFEIIDCDECIHERIWNEEEKMIYKTSPLFMIHAKKI